MMVFEVILAAISYYAGKMTWQLFKRGRFLKTIASDQAGMTAFISAETIGAFLQKNPVHMKKGPAGYVGNISLLIDIDLRTQRRLKLLFGTVTVLALIGSAYLSTVFLLINAILFFLTGIYPLTESGRRNAHDLMLTLGAILYTWRKEDEKECDEWISQASSLLDLYALIKNMK